MTTLHTKPQLKLQGTYYLERSHLEMWHSRHYPYCVCVSASVSPQARAHSWSLCVISSTEQTGQAILVYPVRGHKAINLHVGPQPSFKCVWHLCSPNKWLLLGVFPPTSKTSETTPMGKPELSFVRMLIVWSACGSQLTWKRGTWNANTNESAELKPSWF